LDLARSKSKSRQGNGDYVREQMIFAYIGYVQFRQTGLTHVLINQTIYETYDTYTCIRCSKNPSHEGIPIEPTRTHRSCINLSNVMVITFLSGWTLRDVKIIYGCIARTAHNHEISLRWKTHGRRNSHTITITLWRNYLRSCSNLQMDPRVPDRANINLWQASFRLVGHLPTISMLKFSQLFL
jgi:hypothetical protein